MPQNVAKYLTSHKMWLIICYIKAERKGEDVMEYSEIYNLLDNKILHEWREEIEKNGKDSWFMAGVREAFEKLEPKLDEEEKKLLTDYSLAIENKLDYIYYNLKIKILNFGVKIGMELERAFAEFEE